MNTSQEREFKLGQNVDKFKAAQGDPRYTRSASMKHSQGGGDRNSSILEDEAENNLESHRKPDLSPMSKKRSKRREQQKLADERRFKGSKTNSQLP